MIVEFNILFGFLLTLFNLKQNFITKGLIQKRAMTPDEYCQEKTQQSSSSFYYSFLFLDDTQRQAITALYAFCREVDDIVDECSEPSIAASKLSWWREEVTNLFHGTASHPVTIALKTAISNYPLQEKHFMELIAGMEMDLYNNQYASFNESIE